MHFYIKTILLTVFLGASLVSNGQASYLQWAKEIGNTSYDYGNSIVTDKFGNSYTGGDFRDTVDFDSSVGVHKLYSNPGGFILKLDASGSFIWAKSFDFSSVKSITLDSLENLYAVGYFTGIRDFDPGVGVANLDAATGNIFVVKLDTMGNFVWAKNMGTNNTLSSQGIIAIDLMQNICIWGRFSGTCDFDPGPGIYNLTASSSIYGSAFFCKLNLNGSFVSAKTYSVISSFAIDRSNDIYTISGDSVGMTINKLDASGNFTWTKSISGTGSASGRGISIDSLKNTYVTGTYEGTVDFDPGPGIFNLNSNYVAHWPLTSYYSIFIAKFDSLGNFVWAKSFLNGWYNTGNDIKTDAVGNSYTTGGFRGSIDFDPGPGFNVLTASGDNIFILKLDPDGNFIWAGSFVNGGFGMSLVLDKDENIYTTGYTYGTNISIFKVGQSPVGIKENFFANNISIYPNPTKEILNFQLNEFQSEAMTIEISNALGQIVLKGNLNSQETQVNIETLDNGLYFLKIISKNKIIATQKIIKE